MGRLQFGLDCFDALIEIVHQILLVLVHGISIVLEESGRVLFLLLLQIVYFCLQLFYLIFVLFNDFLTEM